MACKVLFRLTSKFKEKIFPWIDQVGCEACVFLILHMPFVFKFDIIQTLFAQISDILIPLVTFHDGDTRNIAVSGICFT